MPRLRRHRARLRPGVALGRIAPMEPIDVINQRRRWSGQIVTAVAQIPGWVFVMPSVSGRPFSLAYALWWELEPVEDADAPVPPA